MKSSKIWQMRNLSRLVRAFGKIFMVSTAMGGETLSSGEVARERTQRAAAGWPWRFAVPGRSRDLFQRKIRLRFLRKCRFDSVRVGIPPARSLEVREMGDKKSKPAKPETRKK